MLQQGTLQAECGIVKYKANVRVDFWLLMLTHVNFNHVNKIEARLKFKCVNMLCMK